MIIKKIRKQEKQNRDGNFASPLNLLLLASLRSGFLCPAKVMGQGWGKILVPHHGAGRGWVQTFQTHLGPPCPSPSPSCPVLLRVIIVNFSYPKTLLFKQTYQYQLILFYTMWFSAFILLCYTMRCIYIYIFVIVLLNTWIYYSIFFSSKN